MTENQAPWYQRTYRWGQTTTTEIDPIRYDIPWWREHWRRTRVQGVVINAGGIVAYYPSKLQQHRAHFLGERDLYGELVQAAREDGLAVLARMDCNRTYEPLYNDHPEWYTRDAEGRPYREGELFVTCINSPYYDWFIPAVIREIIERSHPDGLTDNSWSGMDRRRICFCANCERKFREATGQRLPRAADWNNPVYRQWIVWNYARRVEVFDLFNRVSAEAGGPDCLYLAMMSGNVLHQSARFRDCRALFSRSKMLMLDHQSRTNPLGFTSNAEAGKLIHGIMGWDKVMPESIAHYQGGVPTFRLGSKPAWEARMWAVEGFAAGITPWWHHIGAYHEDRRQYKTAEPIFRWHEANERYLLNRTPVATVGIVWSQTNVDFYGRDAAEERVAQPWQGAVQAMIRQRVQYVPVHADDIPEAPVDVPVLLLPNLAAMSDTQCSAIRRYVEAGGSIVATGETSLYDEWGDRRPDFALADVFGVHATGTHHGQTSAGDPSWEVFPRHSYLRLTPELRAGVYGPKTGDEPEPVGKRHPILRGLDEADVIGFGGRLEVVYAGAETEVLATFVPPFPIYPPETSWMRQPRTTLPAIVAREAHQGGRVAYLAADLDRCYGRDYQPDHGDIVANAVRWAARDDLPVEIEGRGYLDCHLYRQDERLILHIVNLTNPAAWRAPISELIPVGPIVVTVPARFAGGLSRASLLVAGADVEATRQEGGLRVVIPSVELHEVVVLE